MSESSSDNFFTNELCRYFQELGETLSPDIVTNLDKSPFELDEEERAIYQNQIEAVRSNIKLALKERLIQSGVGREAWMAHLPSTSQSIIGMLAREMLEEMATPLLDNPDHPPNVALQDSYAPQPPVKVGFWGRLKGLSTRWKLAVGASFLLLLIVMLILIILVMAEPTHLKLDNPPSGWVMAPSETKDRITKNKPAGFSVDSIYEPVSLNSGVSNAMVIRKAPPGVLGDFPVTNDLAEMQRFIDSHYEELRSSVYQNANDQSDKAGYDFKYNLSDVRAVDMLRAGVAIRLDAQVAVGELKVSGVELVICKDGVEYAVLFENMSGSVDESLVDYFLENLHFE